MTDMIKWQSALIAFVVCMCQMFTPAGAQEAGTRVHVVQRGEDIGSVAAKYGEIRPCSGNTSIFCKRRATDRRCSATELRRSAAG